MLLRHDGSRLGQILQRVEQRLVTFRQVGHLGGPVVHLGVDVDRVFAFPRRLLRFVPQALQIGRLPARSAGGNHQIAAELEEQRRQLGVFRTERFQTLVRGHFHPVGDSQVERHSAEQCLVIGHVCLTEFAVRSVANFPECTLIAGGRIAANVPEVDETGRTHQDERRVVGPDDLDALIRGFRRTSARLHEHPRLESRLPVFHLAGHDQRIVAGRSNGRAPVWATERNRAIDLAGLIGCQPHDNGIGRKRRERLAPICHAADSVLHRRHRLIDVQFAAVPFDLFVTGELQCQVAERLVGFLAVRAAGVDAHELFVAQLVSFALFAVEQQLAENGQVLDRAAVSVVVWFAAEQRVVVELVPRLGRTAEDHRTQPPVADRQGFDPFRGRFVIPQLQRPSISPSVGRNEQANDADPPVLLPGCHGKSLWKHSSVDIS